MKLYAGLNKIYDNLDDNLKIIMSVDKKNAEKMGNYIYQIEVPESQIFNATNRSNVYRLLDKLLKEIEDDISVTKLNTLKYAENILKGTLNLYELPFVIFKDYNELTNVEITRLYDVIYNIDKNIIRYNNPMFTGNKEVYVCYKNINDLNVITVVKK